MAKSDSVQKQAIADLYNRVASSYGRVGPDFFSQLGYRLVNLVGIAKGEQVLDVATGRGANLFPTAEKVGPDGHVIGIDLSEAMLEQTAGDIQRRGLQNVTTMLMDAEHLQFDNASFDAVLCSFAVFLFPHLDQALAEFHRVLRPGGNVGITVAQDADEVSKRFGALLTAYHEKYQFPISVIGSGKRLDYAQLPNLLVQAGFADVQVITEEAEFIYADEQEWWSSKWTHGPRYALERIPAEVQEQFKDEVFAMLGALKQADGIHERLLVSFSRGNIE